MKTFKLKSLIVLDQQKNDITQYTIPLIDGLIIDREDNDNQWVIEAYVHQAYEKYFMNLRKKQNEIMLQVKITKEDNDPAFFQTKIIGMNTIGQNINVLFKGTIIDRRQNKFEELVKKLIEKGYYDEGLLLKIKNLMKKD